jgi:Chaperone of endosialidase
MLTKKNKCYLLLLIILIINNTFAQNVGINTSGAAPNTSAMLDIVNTTKGLLIPRVSLVATNNNAPIGVGIAISLLVYNIATAGVAPNNVLPGYYYWDGVEWIALAGDGSKNWGLLGNAGTVDGTNFIGTTDNVPLNFRVNNQKAGRIDNTLANSFFGYQAGNSNITGSSNTGIGFFALTTNNTGTYNTAIGISSLRFNSSGIENTAQGAFSLYNNNGNYNSAFGYNSLLANSNGGSNTAFGHSSLQSNTIGGANTAVGVDALRANINGNRNTAIGFYALRFYTSGDENTAIGYQAMSVAGNGSNNTCIGAGANVPIGANSNQVRIGNTLVTYSGIQVAWTITSDKRWKSEIKPSNLGLDFIKELKPVYYVRNNDVSKKTEYGFIAQDVDEILAKFGCLNNGVISKDDAGMFGMRYNDLISITVKAIQEQQDVIDNQNNKIKSLEERLILLEAKLK